MRRGDEMIGRSFLVLICLWTFAAFGESSPPPEVKDQKTESPFNRYKRVEWSHNGKRLRQYASSDTGALFAFSWTGQADETVNQLLGSYAADLKKHDQEHPPRTGRIPYRKVDAGRVVFEFWNLPKMVKGRAYVPSLMPSTVTTDNIE